MNSEKVKEIKIALECWQESVMLSADNKEMGKSNKELKDRIAELEKENESLKKQLIAIDTLDETNFEKRHNAIVFITKKQLKQFAERLIDKKIKLGERFNIYDIDETLKEFINE